MRGSCRRPGARPGARLEVEIPFSCDGCGGRGSAGGSEVRFVGGAVPVTGVDVREEERECFAVPRSADTSLIVAAVVGEVGA